MRSGRSLWVAGALLVPALMLGGIAPRAPMAISGSVVRAGDILFYTTGTGYIGIRDGSTGNVTTLSTGWTPDVSPDGSKIAFVTKADDGSGSSTLHVMNSDGSGITQLVPRDMNSHDDGTDSTSDQDPRWSPDGQWIVFNRVVNRGGYGNYWEIDKVRADGTGLSTIASVIQTSVDAASDQYPTWSPTKDTNGGYRIAFMNDDQSTGGHLYIVNADGSNLHLASTVNVFQGNSVIPLYPNWSPDGSRIYFEQGNILYFSSTDGFTGSDATVNLLQAGTQAETLHLSADGSTLLFFDVGNGATMLSTSGTGSPVPLANSLNEFDPTLVPATWPNANTKNVVGLGDSVAAGEGINYGFLWEKGPLGFLHWVQTGPNSPSWMDTTRAIGASYPGCHQSGKGYPELLSLNGGNYNVYNMACTGASALQNNGLENGGVLDREILGDGTSPAAQLGGNCTDCDPPSAVFNSHKPSIVTLTLGANDINFANWIETCYGPGECDTAANTNELNSELNVEKTDLRTVMSQLNTWAAGRNKILRILVTDYYNPFPIPYVNCIDTGGVPISPGYDIGINANEETWLVNGLHELNQNISDEVTYAQANDPYLKASLVDLSGNFGGSDVMANHKFCSSSPWAYGPSIDYSLQGVFLGFSPAPFHPTPDGQRKIYMAVKAHLP